MLSCKDLTHLVSESMDQSLPLRKRIGMRFHLIICRRCRFFQRQMAYLRGLMRGLDDCIEDENKCAQLRLSQEARERIQEKLKHPDAS